MNNKKLSRLLEPNMKLYFLCLALFVAARSLSAPFWLWQRLLWLRCCACI